MGKCNKVVDLINNDIGTLPKSLFYWVNVWNK